MSGAVIWSLGLALVVQGCSAAGTAPAAGSTDQASAIQPAAAATSSSSPSSPSPTASAFKQDPVDAAFAKKLDALCNEWNSFASSHQYPAGANPQAATREDLPNIAAWMDTLTINHELVARATALGTPAAGTTSWIRVLDAFTAYQESVATAAAAAKAGDLQAWQTAEVGWSAARDDVRQNMLVAGIGAQSTCALPFIRPSGHADG